MASANASTFDVGPLSWVKTEIDHSLGEARQHLDKVVAEPADGKSLKYVQTHLHQVTGALSMVGLGTAARFNEELEATVSMLSQPEAKAETVIATAKKAMSVLSAYLDSLLAGLPNRPMALAPSYVELSRLRGSSEASEADLFFPDLGISLPAPDDTVVVPTREMMEQSLKLKRSTFQAGLLKLLRDRDFNNGVRLMKEAVLGVEALQLHSPSRTFWFTVSGFLDAVALSADDQRSVAVSHFGKIDQQIKLLQEGVHKVPERLFRDLLLVVGRSQSASDRIRQIRAMYSLDDLLAYDDQHRGDGKEEALKNALRILREQTGQLKESWLKFTSGNRSVIDAFVKQAEGLTQASGKLGNADISLVYRAVATVGAALRASGLPASEAVALEMATALLFLENSLDNFTRLGPEFSAQARNVVGRVTAAQTGTTLPALDGGGSGLMDDMSRRAQERLLIFQVGQEVQVNLQQIEQVLDNYFRDPLKSGELKTLSPLFSQVQGALAILDLNEAAALNQLIARRVADYASGASKGEGEDAEGVAEGVSALGLYIGALQQGAANPLDALMPALIRFGLAEKPAEKKAPEKAAAKASVSEADIEVSKQKAQDLYQEWKSQPEAAGTREQLKQTVEEIRRDAELVADKDTAEKSAQALSLLSGTEDPNKTGLHEAFSIIAPAAPAAPPEPSAQAVQLLDKEGAEIDAELLEIFLEEAGEVVATINEHHAMVSASPSDKEALTTIRRGFHTLKGSGRMVGLTDLGEVAWQCEQVMNKWLKEEKPASSALLQFISLAANSFGGWVGDLKSRGHTQIDGSVIAGIADAIKSDREPVFPGEATTAAAPAPAPAAEEPTLALSADEPTLALHADEPTVALSASEPAALSLELPAVELPAIEQPAAPAPAADELSLDLALPVAATAVAAAAMAAAPSLDLSLQEPAAPAAAALPDLDVPVDFAVAAPAAAGVPATPEVPAIDFAAIDFSAPTPAPAPVPEPAPALELPVEAFAASAVEPAGQIAEEPAVAADEDSVVIGDMVLIAALFDIYLEEARGHLATLQRESAHLAGSAENAVSHEFMRAAHTLTGSSNTTGVQAVAQLGHALEMWAKAVIEFPHSVSADTQSLVEQCVHALEQMINALEKREVPLDRPDLAEELKAARESVIQTQRVGEDTLVRTGRFYGLSPDAPPAQETAAIDESPVAAPASEVSAAPDFAFDAPAAEPVAPSAAPAADAGQLDVAAFDFLKASVPETTPAVDQPSDSEVPVAAETAVPQSVASAETDFAFLDTPTEAPTEAAAAPVVPAVEDFTFDVPAEATAAPLADSASAEADPLEAAFFADTASAAETPPPLPDTAAAPALSAEDAFFADDVPADAANIPQEASAEAEAVAQADAEPASVADPAADVPSIPEVPAPEPEATPAANADGAIAALAALTAAAGATAAVASLSPTDAPVAPDVPAPPAAPVAPAAPAAEAAPATETAPAATGEGVFEAGKEKRRIQDDIDTDLLPIFLEEAKEIVPSVGESLRAWKGTPTDHTPVVELARHLHTLKGSARMAGLMRLGELAHIIETHVIDMDKESAPTQPRFERFEEYWDRFTTSIDKLESGEALPPAIEVPIADVFEHQKDKPGAIAVMAAAAAAVREEIQLEGRERQALLRVNADLIDRFVNEAGELAITRSRVDGEMVTFKRSMAELAENVTRMRTQLREIEIEAEMAMASRIKERDEHSETFDPLEFDRFSRMQEVTRFLAESLYDVVTLQQSLQKNLDEVEAALTHQGRLNRDLQQGLMGVRLVPLGNLQDRLYRIVRQTAKELNKKANLEFRGARVELDRSVLEKITAPFEHLLRNAIAHGLETPDRRLESGKSEIGEISIDANQVGNEVVLTVRDDGAGLNFPRIRARAIEAGLMQASDDLPEDQLAQFIFMPGFSTASEVTAISGRGVGMDVVKNEIVSLGGRIELASVAGKGATFTITLPLTLAVTQAVMVRVGDAMYAIPSVMVEQVQEYKGKKYDAMLAMTDIDWKGNRYPFRSLEALLGGAPQQSVLKRAYAILAKSGQQRGAVQVDEIIGNREVVVKQIGPQLARLPGVSGATVLGNGQVVLILNPVQLVFREAAAVAARVAPANEETAEPVVVQQQTVMEPTMGNEDVPAVPLAEIAPAAVAPLVMVVDDSLTVRKITSRMLTREGYEVATAKDGVDGLKQLQDIQPSIILLDIEMPRMDGFEFARNVRADPKVGKIPIIMITSRTADKHRNHAMDIGVNEYMGKPYQEDQLLSLIRQYVGLARHESP